MRHPAAIVAVSLLAGAAAGGAWPARPAAAAAGLLPLSAAALAAFSRRRPYALVAAVSASSALSGFTLAADAGRRALRPPLVVALAAHPRAIGGDAPVLVEGWLGRDAEVGEEGARLDLFVADLLAPGPAGPAHGRVRLSVRGAQAPAVAPTWRAGRRVRVWALLREPTEYRNPGTAARSAASAERGGALVGSVKSARLVEVLARGSPPAEIAARARAHVRRAIAAHVGRRSHRAAAIVTAILIGDRTDLDEQVERRLQEGGTYHVIAISGGNIAILAALVLGALRLAGVTWRAASALTIAALAAYAYLVGDEASVARATLVAAVYLGARALDHRTPPLNALAVAAAVLVAIRPLVVADAGFVLSFGATLGILAGVVHLVQVVRARLARRGWRHTWVPLAVAGLGAATVCAELALFPVSAYVFSRVTFAGLALNFLAIPLMTVAQVAGLAVTFLSPVSGWGADRAGDVAAWAADGLVGSAGLVELAPWLSHRLPPPPIWLVAAYYAGWTGWFALGRRRRPRVASAVVAALSGALVLAAPRGLGDPPRAGWLRVTFLDVGQGDATLVQFPGGRSLLVDAGGAAGGRFDVGGRVVSPALWRLGVRRLDYLAITHADPDHVGGAGAVLRDFAPRAVWEGVPVPRAEALRVLAAGAATAGAAWRVVQTGDRLRVGPVEVVAWHPPPPDWERQKVRNDDSLVLELRWGGVSIVLPGDVGRDVEGAVARRLDPAAVRVLKVPHHGSASSSSPALLEAARPWAAVISAGRGNPFGHPAPAVLGRYRAIGAGIFRTDRDGAVTVETDGHEVLLSTFSGRRFRLSR